MTRKSMWLAGAVFGGLFLSAGFVIAGDETMKGGDKPKIADGLTAVIKTSKGEIRAKLYPDGAPLTVLSFVNLAERGYFDGLNFHRFDPGFVIQGGDPEGNGSGGPGYRFKNETSPALKHDSAGILSMANAGRDTNGSQFFITLRATPELDGGYSVFGKVMSGMEAVNAVRAGEVMETVTIEGDYKALADANKQQLDEWNKILDAKYPRVPTNERGPAHYERRAKEKKAKMEQEAKEKGKKVIEEASPYIKDKLKLDPAKFTVSPTGLWHFDVKEGDGAAAKDTDIVSMHYTGWVTSGEEFDSSVKRGKPLEFRMPKAPTTAMNVIPGWTEGANGMKVGGKRILVIPPNLAYGPQSRGAIIKANSILIFEMELMGLK